MSNAREGNVVVAYGRNSDGTIDEVGRYETDGTGSGSFEDSANGLVLATSAGEISPNNLVEPADDDQQFLLAVNPGSDNISVFAVQPDGLELVEVQGSNGYKPVSVTVSNGLVFVLNSGEDTDDLFDADGGVINNCTTGDKPTLSGFRLDSHGQLTLLPGSTRQLSGARISGCAQVSFDPTGTTIVVTERLAQPNEVRHQESDNERLDDEGVIDTFSVKANGKIRRTNVIDATGQGPFGFTFNKDNVLLTTEQSDGPGGVARSTVSSYVLDSENMKGRSGPNLLRSSPAIQNGGTDSCWIVITDDQKLAFSTSFFEDGRISSYEVDEIGIVRVIEAIATGPDAVNDDVEFGSSDLALSRDSGYLYQLNSINGTISAFANNGDGTLTLVEMEMPFPQPAFGPGGGQAAPTGLAAS